MIEVKTQAQLDKVLSADPNAEVRLVKGSFNLIVTGVAAPLLIVLGGVELNVVAWGSSQPRVVAWGSSQPRVEAWGSSQPRVEAWGSSQPRVVAWESSQPRVVAWGYSMLAVQGRVCGTAAETVSVHIEGDAKIDGGHQVIFRRHTAEEWCAYYGVQVLDGVATLYKGLRENYRSAHGGDYTPGTIPSVPKFVAEPECGPGALYFSPTPRHTHQFENFPVHYVACPVRVADIVAHPNGNYPAKVKAKGCCAPVFEVDEDGEPIVPANESEAA